MGTSARHSRTLTTRCKLFRSLEIAIRVPNRDGSATTRSRRLASDGRLNSVTQASSAGVLQAELFKEADMAACGCVVRVHQDEHALSYQVEGRATMDHGLALRRCAEEALACGVIAIRADLR